MLKYLNKIFDLAAYDGLKHLVLSLVLTKVFLIFLPFWIAIGVTLVITIAKEMYDKISRKGVADWKDIICNIIGIILAIW